MGTKYKWDGGGRGGVGLNPLPIDIPKCIFDQNCTPLVNLLVCTGCVMMETEWTDKSFWIIE